MMIIRNWTSIDLNRDVSIQMLVLIVDPDQLLYILLVDSVNLALISLLSRPHCSISHFFPHN